MSEPARFPVVDRGDARAVGIAQGRVPVSRIMNSPAPARRTGRVAVAASDTGRRALSNFIQAYLASRVGPDSFITQPSRCGHIAGSARRP